jgi:hypothetical protein
LNHNHEIKKTRVSFIEFDDVIPEKLAVSGYYGEGNSKGRHLEFDFEYCLGCGLRLLNGEPALTKEILDDELETFVKHAMKGNYVVSKEVIVQHSDFEALENLIKNALAFGKLREVQSGSSNNKLIKV